MSVRLTRLVYVIILLSGIHPLMAQETCEDQLLVKEDSIKLLKVQIADLKQKGYDAIKAHEGALEGLINENKDKLHEKNEEIKRQKERIVALEKTLDNERADSKPLKDKNKELDSRIEEGLAKIERLKSEKAALNKEKKDLQSEVKDLERKNGDLETTKKQLLDKQKQNKEEIQKLNEIIRQKDNAIALLEPIKSKILDEIKSGVEGLYHKIPANGEVEFSYLESRFSLALSFKDSTDVIELKKKFRVYEQQFAYIKKAGNVLEGKYSEQNILSAQSDISKVTIPVFEEEKQRLIEALQGYCKANNEIVAIFENVHKFGSKDTRTAVLQNSLQAIEFDLESYPFLYEKAKEKQRDITANSIPGELKEETCPN